MDFFPSSIYDAHICVLLKKDRDSTNVASYRPLSILNSNQKMVAKVLTNRLNKHVGSFIHPNQAGFIPDRFSFSNTRRLLNIIYSTNLSQSAVISLDAKQAFDQIEWKYMFATLKKFGFSDKFLTLLKMLYACPKSTILTNHDKSRPFLLHRGTRQGCSLSPLLFALALEPNNLPFKVSTEPFVYLAVNISRTSKLLFKLNYSDLIGKLKVMIDKWKLLPLSLIGRVNIIKMVVLPKCMYLFQNIPIYLTASFFKLIDSIIIPFIWANKPCCICKVHLHKPTAEGGLGLPFFRHYY